jgi:hypothetical protein
VEVEFIKLSELLIAFAKGTLQYQLKLRAILPIDPGQRLERFLLLLRTYRKILLTQKSAELYNVMGEGSAPFHTTRV